MLPPERAAGFRVRTRRQPLTQPLETRRAGSYSTFLLVDPSRHASPPPLSPSLKNSHILLYSLIRSLVSFYNPLIMPGVLGKRPRASTFAGKFLVFSASPGAFYSLESLDSCYRSPTGERSATYRRRFSFVRNPRDSRRGSSHREERKETATQFSPAHPAVDRPPPALSSKVEYYLQDLKSTRYYSRFLRVLRYVASGVANNHHS